MAICPHRARRRPAPLGAVTLLLTFAAAGCTQQAPPATTEEKPAAAAQPAAAAPAKGQLPKGFDFPSAPADGKWLIDAQGRRYFEHEVVKIEGTYARIPSDKHVKFWWTPPFELLRESDSSFFVKIYSAEAPPEQAPAVASAPAAPAPAPEQSGLAGSGDRVTFARWSQGLPTHGQWRQGFDVADVDGDGNLDIVHGPPRKGGSAPAIFLGDGKGSWRRLTGLRLPDLPLDYGDAAAADFNGDGRTDLAFASHLKGIVVVVADGNGGYRRWSDGIHFETRGETPATEPFTSRAIEAVDVDGDGRPDLLALGEGPTLRAERQNATGFSRGSRGTIAYLNQGDGTWKRQDVGGTSFGDALLVADFNGDRRIDVATASASHGDKALVNLSRPEGGWAPAAIEALPAAAVVRAVAAADFDGDGRQDLAVGYSRNAEGEWHSGVGVLLARPDGSWQRRTLHELKDTSVGVWSVATGDLDGNGAADLVALTGDGATWVFLGDGKGSFTRDESPELALKESDGCTGYAAALEDLDGDGKAELLAAFAGEGGNYFGGDMIEKCRAGGSLQVWKAAPRVEATAAKRRP